MSDDVTPFSIDIGEAGNGPQVIRETSRDVGLVHGVAERTGLLHPLLERPPWNFDG